MCSLLILFFEAGSQVSQIGLKLSLLTEENLDLPSPLPPPPKSWNYKCVSCVCGAGDGMEAFACEESTPIERHPSSVSLSLDLRLKSPVLYKAVVR